jgi:hypothetical protein
VEKYFFAIAHALTIARPRSPLSVRPHGQSTALRIFFSSFFFNVYPQPRSSHHVTSSVQQSSLINALLALALPHPSASSKGCISRKLIFSLASFHSRLPSRPSSPSF